MKISEVVAIVFAVVILAAFLIGGLGYSNYLLSKASCDQVGKRLGITTIYEFPSGCYRITNGRWTLLHLQEKPPSANDIPVDVEIEINDRRPTDKR